MESLGANIYEKCSNYLGFLALGCEMFQGLDWVNFQNIAAQKRKEVDEVMNEIDLELL